MPEGGGRAKIGVPQRVLLGGASATVKRWTTKGSQVKGEAPEEDVPRGLEGVETTRGMPLVRDARGEWHKETQVKEVTTKRMPETEGSAKRGAKGRGRAKRGEGQPEGG